MTYHTGPAEIEYDERGRRLTDGRDALPVLTDTELEVELTIAAAEPRRREARLDAVLHELARRGLRPAHSPSH